MWKSELYKIIEPVKDPITWVALTLIVSMTWITVTSGNSEWLQLGIVLAFPLISLVEFRLSDRGGKGMGFVWLSVIVSAPLVVWLVISLSMPDWSPPSPWFVVLVQMSLFCILVVQRICYQFKSP